MADAPKLDRRLMEQLMFGAGRARKGDDDFTIWLTNPTNEFELAEIGKGVQAFFDAETAAGRKYRVNQRKSKELSIVIEV
jgi:hypothetical protein